MKWCEVVGAEPYLALNFGTGTLDEGTSIIHFANSVFDNSLLKIESSVQRSRGLSIATPTGTHTTPTYGVKTAVKSLTM